MIYALRKLIAFVFLGGMFWFIYQDLDNLDKPWFMHALGLITVVFAFFWLLIPMVVVRLRIHRRRVQNRERYVKWRAEMGDKGLFNSIPFAELKSFSDTPGGIVFDVGGDGAEALLAFTFQNPLIAADVLRFARKDAK